MLGINGREELIIEGSTDGIEWKEYEFYYKPGSLSEPPKFTFTHQPRLDWQLWYAALENNINGEIWLVHLLSKLFRNSPSVLSLVRFNPFPEEGPMYLRVQKFKYWFTSVKEAEVDGEWWRREFTGFYLEFLERNDKEMNRFLKKVGFETLENTYPLHVLQEIPVLEMLMAFFLINIFINFISSEHKT